MTILLIALGGAVGSVLRYLVGGAVQTSTHSGFPFGTLAVNVVGCFVIGALTRGLFHTQTHDQLRAALIVGFCGGFTTFSAFSMETVGLIDGGSTGAAATYVSASVVGCLAATFAGVAAGRLLSP